MKRKAFDKPRENELDKLHERIMKLISTSIDPNVKLTTPASIMKEYSENTYTLCMFQEISGNKEISEKLREVLIENCAFCLFGMSALANELGVSFSEIIRELEIKVIKTEKEKWN